MLVNEINRIINSEKFSRRYDDVYSGVTFLGHRVFRCGNVPSGGSSGVILGAHCVRYVHKV